MACKRTIEFQRRVKRARLVRKDLAESGYDVKTRARASCAANVWARGSRCSAPHPAAAPIGSTSAPAPAEKVKPSSSSCMQLVTPTPHESLVKRNDKILKMVLRNRPYQEERGTKGKVPVAVSLKHQKGKLRCLRSRLAKRNACKRMLQNSIKVKAKAKEERKSSKKKQRGIRLHKCKNKLKSLRKRYNLDRTLEVKLERLTARELSKVRTISTGKRPRGRPPKQLSVSGVIYKRKVGRPSKASVLDGVLQKRKVGRPPMSPASRLKAQIRRNALKRHKHTINISKMRRMRGPAPKLSIMELVVASLNEDPKEKRVTDIYHWISNRYSYFHPEDKIWKNAVRHSLTTCPFFEKCEQGPDGGTRPWKIDLECTTKWNRYRRESKCRSLPKFPSRKRMRKLLKSQPLLVKASSSNDFTTNNDRYREQLIEQTINQHARQYNVTCLQSTSSMLYHEMSDLLLQADSLCARTEVILPVQYALGHKDCKKLKASSSTNEGGISHCMDNCGTWMRDSEYEFMHTFQPLTPIHYGDDVPEFEHEQITIENLTNNNVHCPFIKLGLFELHDDPDYAKYFISHCNSHAHYDFETTF